MIDHIGMAVSDLDRAKAFYTAPLKPLGNGLIVEVTAEQTGGGRLRHGRQAFLLDRRAGDTGHTGSCRLYGAVARRGRCLLQGYPAAGGTDNGAPGLRPQYRADYYGASALDSDGHNIEAVCHAPG